MQIIGLTGSAATGKSTVTRQLRLAFRIRVWDADQEVRKLYEMNSAIIKMVEKEFPSVVKNGEVNLRSLREIAFSEPNNLNKLQKILYPFLYESALNFINRQQKANKKFCVLDIPLLFEKKWDTLCHKTITLLCDKSIQIKRLKKRGLGHSQIESILKNQMPMEKKAELADCCLSSNLSRYCMFQQLQDIIRSLCCL